MTQESPSVTVTRIESKRLHDHLAFMANCWTLQQPITLADYYRSIYDYGDGTVYLASFATPLVQ